MNIPKRMGHIWIGPKAAPVEWMQTWKERHPDWEYVLYDNAYLETGSFRTRRQIDEYMKRGWYHGASDLLRYEILFEHGGYLAEADSVCLEPIDELFEDSGTLYTVYENEFLRGKLVSPIQASIPGHPFVAELLSRLERLDPERLDQPWKQTGNLFVAQMIEELQPEITIWPSHTLIPEHFTGIKYTGTGKIYARQHFGSTVNAYKFNSVWGRLMERRKSLYASMARKRLRRLARLDRRS